MNHRKKPDSEEVLLFSISGETHRGYYWVYQNSIDGVVLFDYREGRGRERPANMLENFSGYLQTDGYQVYDHFDDRKEIRQIHCMAHARRKFTEAVDNNKESPNTHWPKYNGFMLSKENARMKD